MLFRSEKKEPYVVLIWWFGFLFSLFCDIASDVSLGIGGPVVLLAGIISLRQLVLELKNSILEYSEKEKAQSKPSVRVFKASLVVLSVIAVFVKGGYIASERLLPSVEIYASNYSPDEMCAVVSEGPCKGVVTTQNVKSVYDAMLRDLDLIKAENLKNAPVMVAGICPAAYLYLDFPIGNPAVFYESRYYEEQQYYWVMFPQKIPNYIYVPDYSFFTYRNSMGSDKRTDLLQILPPGADYKVTEAETGRIVKILK